MRARWREREKGRKIIITKNSIDEIFLLHRRMKALKLVELQDIGNKVEHITRDYTLVAICRREHSVRDTGPIGGPQSTSLINALRHCLHI